ncbi:uncharacterized protein LOC108608512 isoform X1 [Drosophila busckii]|uniref:uncharacterized protein LOC108608512 isoform X1 n=1 Tax=Drosophila busckii TaxID=30019 RepID=UPI00083EDDF8|nr:uncharacterized protein LOC108608512 isoform X1 [Drosophila busckii]
MGCITSTNKLHELGQDNVFRVRVAHLQPSGPEAPAPIIRSGFLELTPRELIFITPGCEPIVWALHNLRRYGLNGDLFCLEAGRRCMSGPGIYTFRIHNAEQLYPMFQRYINAVNTDAFAQVERERERVNSVLLGRSDVQPHSNNYLEPAPLLSRAALQLHGTQLHDGPSSPDSLPNLQLVGGEQLPDSGALQSPITPGAYINTACNLYFDQPLQRILQEQRNSNTPPDATPTATNSAFSTMRRQQQSIDMPPQESAPALNESVRLYANVETPRERLIFDMPNATAAPGNGSERCYENIGPMDLPLLTRDSSQQSVASSSQQQQQQQPGTPTSVSGVNYIVLDLDQPRSPGNNSPKVLVQCGSGIKLILTAPDTPEKEVQRPAAAKTPTTESSGTQGYSTIDFIRTNALNKSSTAQPPDSETAVLRQHDHPHEEEELRMTRHSKCVRKAYSISE